MTRTGKTLAMRRLGSQGPEVAEIGLGTIGMTMAYGAADTIGGNATIGHPTTLGVTLFDTAEMYGYGTAKRATRRPGS